LQDTADVDVVDVEALSPDIIDVVQLQKDMVQLQINFGQQKVACTIAQNFASSIMQAKLNLEGDLAREQELRATAHEAHNRSASEITVLQDKLKAALKQDSTADEVSTLAATCATLLEKCTGLQATVCALEEEQGVRAWIFALCLPVRILALTATCCACLQVWQRMVHELDAKIKTDAAARAMASDQHSHDYVRNTACVI
jgi:hypothetical protein